MISFPTGSMSGIWTYICHKNQPNVGKYAIHGFFEIAEIGALRPSLRFAPPSETSESTYIQFNFTQLSKSTSTCKTKGSSFLHLMQETSRASPHPGFHWRYRWQTLAGTSRHLGLFLKTCEMQVETWDIFYIQYLEASLLGRNRWRDSITFYVPLPENGAV